MLSKSETDELDKIADNARLLIYKNLMKSDVLHVGLSRAAILYIANKIKERNEQIRRSVYGRG